MSKRFLMAGASILMLSAWSGYGNAEAVYDDPSVVEPVAISIVENEMSTMKGWSKKKDHLNKKLVAKLKEWESSVRFAVFDDVAHCAFTSKNNYECYVYATPIHYQNHVPNAGRKINIKLRLDTHKMVTSVLIYRKKKNELALANQILQKKESTDITLFQYGSINEADPIVEPVPSLTGMNMPGAPMFAPMPGASPSVAKEKD